MFFTLLTFASAIFIEGLGSLVSVIGISALFGANPIIIALAISLDVGKVVVVSLLYTHWATLSRLMKSYALIAAAVTMVITSAGAAGYLSGEFQKAIMGAQEGSLKVDVLKQEQVKLEARKKQIDDQIAAIPDRYTANQKIRVANQFKAEQKQVTERLNEISKELPTLQVSQIGTDAKAGPILYVAKAFNVSVEEAVKWVILMIIFVFDPLAIFLIIAGNFLWAKRKRDSKQEYLDTIREDVRKIPAPPRVVEPQSFSMPAGAEFPKHGIDGALFYRTDLNAPFIYAHGQWNPIGHEEEELSINNVFIDENGVEHRPQMPDFMREQLKPKEETLEEMLERVEGPQEEVMADAPVGKEFPNEEPPLELPTPEPNRTTYVPTGLLKPVNVDLSIDHAPLSFEGPPPIPLGSEIPKREEITRSSLGLVDPDPATIVDAGRLDGFRTANAIVTPPKK